MSERYKVVATNITDMHAEPSFLCEMTAQLFNGDILTVLEEREIPNNGFPRYWSYVETAAGFRGWAYTMYLSVSGGFDDTTHVVSVPCTTINRGIFDRTPLTKLYGGTHVHVERYSRGYAWVQPKGTMLPAGWVDQRDLIDKQEAPDLTMLHEDIIASARNLTGAPFVWGGNTETGMDCSGFPYLVYRMNNLMIPRNCKEQTEAGRKVSYPYIFPGDIIYFWNEPRTAPGHAAIIVSASGEHRWHIIHSSRTRNGVYEEIMQENQNLRETYYGAYRFLPMEPEE